MLRSERIHRCLGHAPRYQQMALAGIHCLHGGSTLTLHDLVVCAFELHLWHADELEFVFAVELGE